jgi:hypothetical protein
MSESSNRKDYSSKIYESVIIAMPKVGITFVSGHPFDLVKTIMQANPSIRSGWILSKDIMKEKGIKGFYTGGIPNLTRSILKEAYRTPLRGGLYYSYSRIFPDMNRSSKAIITGLSMAITDTMIICPLERIKVWIMTNYKDNRSITTFFTNRNEKSIPLFRDLFKGSTVSILRSAASWVSYLVAESSIRDKVAELSPRIDKNNPRLPLTEQLIVGIFGGIINCICTLPFDTIKTNIQKEENRENMTYKEMWVTTKRLLKDHGVIRGLYPGFFIKLIHYSIVGVITSDIIQKVDKVWQE